MKKNVAIHQPPAFRSVLSWLICIALVFGMMPVLPVSAAAEANDAGYVAEDLVLWLDANNNTGTGTHDPDATEWVNLANPEQVVDVSGFAWGEDNEHSAYFLNLSDGWIILPDEVRQAIGSSEFTVEFLMEDYDGTPHTSIRNLMNATGDDEWLDSLTGAVATPNDNFVIFMNQSGGNNNGKFCFRTCYLNSKNGWSNMTNSTDYCKVLGTSINDVTNSVTFKSGGSTIWYLDGAAEASTTNASKLINVDGFRTSPGTASTWQTERKPQITFGTDNSVIASRAPFSAKVKSIRIYKSELSASEVRQNAAVDQERYYTFQAELPEENYVTDNLILWLDANNNTGKGTHDADATKWVNLVNTAETVDVSGFSWGEDSEYAANYLSLEDGCIFLPDSVLDALEGKKFTIEFLMSDFPGAPAAKTQNIMTITGDDEWLASLSGPVATPNDNFVLFQNASGGNNSGYFCFRTCYGAKWSYIFPSSSKYCMVDGTKIADVTNSLTFNCDTTSNWYLDGVKSGTTTNNGNTIDAVGFRTSPGDASTWQTERRGQVTFGIDTDIISNRAPFSAQVKSIRIYTDELTADEVQQNADADQERYYTIPNNSVPEGYVQSGLILFLDGIDNTGEGHDSTVTTWTNLADTTQTVNLPTGTAGSGTWTDTTLDMSGYIILPEEVRQAIAGGDFTVEFLMDDYSGTTIDSTNYRNIFALTGSDDWIASSTTKGSTPNDNFVIYQNKNAGTVHFKINSGVDSSKTRAYVNASSIDSVTNTLTFQTGTKTNWYQDGELKSTSGVTYAAAPDVSSYTGASTGEVPQVVFGAVIDRVSARQFSASVKAIRVYNRALSTDEAAQNAEMDSNRYMNAGRLSELAKDSWNEVVVGNASTTTASGLQAFAESKLVPAAAEHLTVAVTDNKDGTFTFSYISKNNLPGYTTQTYTLYVDTEYELDFSTMTADEQAEFLKDAYAQQGGGGVTVTIEDGKLVYTPKSGGRPVSGLYFPVYYSGDKYVWEMEVTYNGRVGGYTWAGQLFAVQDGETPQNTCTFNLGKADGSAAAYEFCKRTEPNLWANHVTTTLGADHFGDDELDASKFNDNYSAKDGQTFTLKYVVKGSMAFGFIDGVLIVESSNLGTDFSGGFGINSAGPILEVKSIKISPDVSGESVSSPIGYYDVDIYEPETSIAVAPTIMQMADSNTYDVSGEDKRPASIIFDVKAENGQLVAYDGDTKLGTFEELFAANSYKAITGVRIADQAAADLVAAYAKTSGNQNLWAFHTDGTVINSITDDNIRVRGVIDLTGEDISDIVDDDAARTEVYDKVYGPGYRTVLISAENGTKEIIRELQSMKIITLVEAYGLSDAEIYDLVVCGPNGILTDDSLAFIEMLETFDDYTLVRPAAVVGHRGDRTYPDNSLESIISAAESGAAAAEFDVIATLDGKLVLSHDNDNYEAVDYRNGTWAGVKITNAYWSKEAAEAAGRPNDYFEGRYFHTNTSQTAVPYITLDMLFDATGTQYPALTYHIEVKDAQNDKVNGGKLVVNLIDELLQSEKYSDLRGRCDILCFNKSINTPSKEKGYAVHNQNSITVTDNLANTIYTYENYYRPINSLLEPGANVVSKATLETFKHYGMTCYPWTFNNSALNRAYITGYHGFTTDYPHASDNIYKSIQVEIAANGTVKAYAYTLADHLNEEPINVTDSVEIISVAGSPVISGGTVTGAAGDVIAVRYKQTLTVDKGQSWFYVYSTSIDLSVLCDKTALQEAVDTAKELTEEDYTSDTWAAVEDALETAKEVLADEDATQEEVDAAEEALTEAMEALVERGDKTELQADVDTANGLTEEDYVTETWEALEEALKAAEEVLADIDATQEEIDAAEDKLEEALAALVERGDKTELEELVEEVEDMSLVTYTPDTRNDLEDALEAAQAVLDDPDALQEEVDAAYAALEEALEALERADIPTSGGTVTEPDDGDDEDDDKNPVEVCPSAHLTDVPAVIWYHEYVDYVVANGLMTGVTATTFDPNGTMTRAMVWTVLARLSGEDVDTSITPWYAKAQEWAMENEVSDGTMANNAITREQLVTMLYRYIGEPEVSAADKALLDDYTDGEKVRDWAVDAMAWAISNGIINGVTKDTLDPQGVATRAQVAAILQRFCLLEEENA